MKKMNENIAKVLLSEEEIQKRVKELGRQIHDDYKDKDKIVMIGLPTFRWQLICRCALILWWHLLTVPERKPAAMWIYD